MNADFKQVDAIGRRLGRWAIGVVPLDYCKFHGVKEWGGLAWKDVDGMKYGPFIREDHLTALAHEFGHFSELGDNWDEYKLSKSGTVIDEGNRTSGFWVEGDEFIPNALCLRGSTNPFERVNGQYPSSSQLFNSSWIERDDFNMLFLDLLLPAPE